MNFAFQRPWTTDQFLAWEERQAPRYEFDGDQPRARSGGTAAHAAIQRNLITALGVGLLGKPHQPHGGQLKIRVAESSIRYPDAFVVSTPLPRDVTVVTNPVVIFEIISESTATKDFVIKNAEYRATPSVQRYVVLQQTKAAAAVFSRKGEDWVTDLLTGDGAILAMPEIGLDIPLADIYLGVELTEEDDDARA